MQRQIPIKKKKEKRENSLANKIYIYIYIHKIYLSVCLYVPYKLLNSLTDLGQIVHYEICYPTTILIENLILVPNMSSFSRIKTKIL